MLSNPAVIFSRSGRHELRARHRACAPLTGGAKASETTDEHGTHFGARQSAEL